MAIVKYTFKNGQFPSGITDHGYWKHPVNKTLIGIGNAGGSDSEYKTELTKEELKAYVKTLPNLWYTEMTDISNPATTNIERRYTDAELETHVDDWCTEKGI